jgi:predicted transcriptional regulator
MSETTETRTLQVRVGRTEQTRQEAREKIAALERGEDVEDMLVLNLPNYAELARLMREKNLELLRVLAQHDPASIREVAELVDRDYKEVHRNLNELKTLGVVEFEDVGRSKQPVVHFDELEIDVSLTDPEPADATA